jgi:Leucine-rich repeat (LRR) protein
VNQNLGALNLTNFKKLVNVDCRYNGLTTLDVSGCTALTSLNCAYNGIESLNVSGCSNLTQLSIYQTPISATAINEVLVALDQNGKTNGVITHCIDLSQLDQNLKTALEAKGWTLPQFCGA